MLQTPASNDCAQSVLHCLLASMLMRISHFSRHLWSSGCAVVARRFWEINTLLTDSWRGDSDFRSVLLGLRGIGLCGQVFSFSLVALYHVYSSSPRRRV